MWATHPVHPWIVLFCNVSNGEDMHVRKLARFDNFLYAVFLVIVLWGGLVFIKNRRQESKLDAEKKARSAADIALAKSALVRLRSTWKADDSWENQVSAATYAPSYSMEIEHALVKTSPIIVIGEIQDVKTSLDRSDPLILIRNHHSRNLLDLRFSLVATPEIANSILSATRHNPMAEVDPKCRENRTAAGSIR
jgi:hypothetical protein